MSTTTHNVYWTAGLALFVLMTTVALGGCSAYSRGVAKCVLHPLDCN